MNTDKIVNTLISSLIIVFSFDNCLAIELTQEMGKQVLARTGDRLMVRKGTTLVKAQLTVKFIINDKDRSGRKNVLAFELIHDRKTIGDLSVENARVSLKDSGREFSIPGVELVLLRNLDDKNYKCVGSALLKVLRETYLEQKKSFSEAQKKEAKIYVYAALDGPEVYPKFGFISYRPNRNYDTFFNMVHEAKEWSKFDDQLKKCGM